MKVFIASIGKHIFELEEQDANRMILLGSIRAEIARIKKQYPNAVVVGSQYFKW